jgi:hypothetical protein
MFSLAFALSSNILIVHFMLLVAIWSIFPLRYYNDPQILALIIISIHLVWTSLAIIAFTLNLSPLALTEVRASVLDPNTVSIVVFCAAQFLFISTLLPQTISPQATLKILDKRLARNIALIFVIITTILINQGNLILEGGYHGNTAKYWSGLPVIFIVSIAAWVLLQKKHGLIYFFILNGVVGWWLLNGNRSEILVVFVFGNYLFLRGFEIFWRNSFLRIAIIVGIMVGSFIIFSFIAEIRTEGIAGISSLSVGSTFSSLIEDDRIRVSTFGSSIYSAIVAVHAAEYNGILWGETFIGQIVNTIPSFIPTPWERYQDISIQLTNFQILGGLGFLGEGYINFGLMGPALVATSFIVLMSIAAKHVQSSFISSWFILSTAFYSQRFILYGFVYFYNLLVIFFVFYVIKSIILHSCRRN